MAELKAMEPHPAPRERGAHVRAAIVTLRLVAGQHLTTAEVADLTDLQWSGAYRLMNNLSLELPITQIDGKWQWITRTLAVG